MEAESQEEALEVESAGDEYAWIADHPCRCGGAWEFVEQSLLRSERTERGSRMTDRLDVRCEACGRTAAFFFVVQYDGGLDANEGALDGVE